MTSAPHDVFRAEGLRRDLAVYENTIAENQMVPPGVPPRLHDLFLQEMAQKRDRIREALGLPPVVTEAPKRRRAGKAYRPNV